MKDGICPNSEVYAGTNLSFKKGGEGSNTIPVSFWTSAALDNYVCIKCGYVESYIADSRNLSEIKEKWPKVKSANQQ